MYYVFHFLFWRSRHLFGIGLLTLAMVLAAIYGSPVSHAADGVASFTLNPVMSDPSNPVTRSYFVLNASPGASLQNEVRVTNSGTATGTVRLYAVDAATAQTSGVVYLNQQDKRQDVGHWITLSKQQLTLASGQSQIVPFQVNIPSMARHGQHVGGIVAENTSQVEVVSGNTLQVTVRRRTVVAVQVNLDLQTGSVEQLIATDIQVGGINRYQTLLIRLSNAGTIMLKPHGTLEVFDSQGHLRQNQSLQLDTLLPQTSINYSVYVQHKALEAGKYQARLTLKYGSDHVLSYTTPFTVTEQQIAQTFQNSPPLQAPDGGNTAFSLLLPWSLVGGGFFLFLLMSSILYWRQKLYVLSFAVKRIDKSKKVR